MQFSTIPPFKVFFQIPVGTARADAPELRRTRSIRLSAKRVRTCLISSNVGVLKAEETMTMPEIFVPRTRLPAGLAILGPLRAAMNGGIAR